ncbi:MAG: hypothetical protein LUG26_00020 [Ruminococcus sp.]|nr:hypothetical protein [Ruminococcus sp.]
MDQTNKIGWLTALFRIVIAVFMLFFLGVLPISAIVGTTGMEIVKEGEGVDTVVQQIREQIEAVVFYNDNILANLIWLVLGFCLVFLLMPLLKKLPLWSELTFVRCMDNCNWLDMDIFFAGCSQ